MARTVNPDTQKNAMAGLIAAGIREINNVGIDQISVNSVTLEAKLLNAAIDVIASSGVKAASMARVARKAQISTGKLMDIYLLDNDGNELAYSADNLIEKNFLGVSHSLFEPKDIHSNEIAKVAFEIRKN